MMEGSTSSRGGGRSWRGRRGRGCWWRGRGRSGAAPVSRGKKSSQVDVGGATWTQQPLLVQTRLSGEHGQFSSWPKYFPDCAFSADSDITRGVVAFESYFKQHIAEFSLDMDCSCSLPVDASVLLQDTALASALPDLSDRLANHPEGTLNAMALALHTVLAKEKQSVEGAGVGDTCDDGDCEESGVQNSLVEYDLPRLFIRLYNFGQVIPLKSIKAPLYGKCVTIQGTVVRVSHIRPLVTNMAFQCCSCQQIQAIGLPDNKYIQPSKCTSVECRGRTFVPLRSSPLTETIDWQTVKVQELSVDESREAGRIPRTIECELTSDLVDLCVPGDMVTITGIVKATSSEEASRDRHAKDKCMFLLYLKAISVINGKGKTSTDAFNSLQVAFTTKDYYAISEIHSDKNVFRLIVGSLCPTIYGHEMVKAGLVLGMFGGTQRYADLQNAIPIRGDPHILVVGDPGLGKSQMLQAASNIAPRGVYVCGNTTTTSGLTVTLVKEGGSGNFALEAGALVLADQGCCCIDEFDKMGSQHQALLEAMEQQSISIAKAGVVCSLPARTCILAAANPIGGHYNKAKTVSENLKMNSALLSRFDLVFILLDRPDEELDCLLSEHVMSLHAGGRHDRLRKEGDSTGALTATARRNQQGVVETSLNQSSSSLLLLGDSETESLQERLKIRRGDEFDPIPCQLLRKYVGYARKYVHPKLGEEASEVLQKFYLNLRKQRQRNDSTPITTRQLESLIRLTEARARLELREEVTAQDASDVVEIMKFSMHDTFSDEYGVLDFDRSQHGSGMSQHAQGKRLVSELNRMASYNGCSTFTVFQMKDVAKRIGINMKNFEDLVYSLNNQNYLLKKGPKLYQLQTASCL